MRRHEIYVIDWNSMRIVEKESDWTTRRITEYIVNQNNHRNKNRLGEPKVYFGEMVMKIRNHALSQKL